MCQVFGVSRSGYYNWVQHEPSDRKQSDERLKLEIKVAHIRTRETYGTRRLQTELAENGIIVGRDRLARLRKELRLRCKQKRKFRATTNSNHNLPVAPNLLNQTFAPTAPNQVWVADLTYVATQEGWLYLAGIKDVYTCEIVGYAMGERMTKELTGKALFMALRSQRPPAGLIHHSDRGSQYCAYDYRVIQEQFGLKTSMSRKGNCYDNAPMESFWGTLKNESLSHYRFNNRDEAISVIREYIEIFYNRQRRHSRLGNISRQPSGKNIIRWLLKKEQMVVSAIASTPHSLTPPHSGLCIFKQSQSSHILSILKLTSSSVISFRRGMCYTPCKTVIKDINAIVNDYRIPVDSQYWFATKQCSHT